jgi:hypothetical protein
MSNKSPILPPKETRFRPRWQSGKTKQISLPVAIAPQCIEIAHCIDIDPAIADQVLKFAQSLVE